MSALTPEAYAEVLQEIQARAHHYHQGQASDDIDWLLAELEKYMLRAQECETLLRDVKNWIGQDASYFGASMGSRRDRAFARLVALQERLRALVPA